jgi:hypothetical protein
MECARLQLVLIATADHMTLDDYCYHGACGTSEVSTSPHYSDGLSDISEPLLLPPTVGYMTSDDRGYCWTRGMRAVATSPHSNDELAVHCYWTASSDRLSSAILSLQDCAVATA